MNKNIKRVVFVDDEPEVLRGIERSMSLIDDDWDLAFANSGEEVLEMMAQRRFDAVVTDLRMPGMDGGAVIDAFHDMYPEVARIVLTGQSSREAALRTVHPMHLYLSKPCDAETLQAAIRRALTLQDLLGDGNLKQLAAKLTSLPSKPQLYDQVTIEMASPDASLREIGKLVAQDVAMSAKILQLANSARFGLKRQVADTVQASVVLGMETIRDFVLAIGVSLQFSKLKVDGFDLDEFCDRSLTVAQFARKIALKQNADKAVCDEAFTAGLLHDIGQLVLIDYSANKYQDVLTRICDGATTIWDAERETFGASHASIGAYVLGQWGLPHTVVEAVGFHHHPDRIRHKSMLPVTAVHVAAAFERQQSANPRQWEKHIDMTYLSANGHDKSLASWNEVCLAKQHA